jgi:hypothetical protein
MGKNIGILVIILFMISTAMACKFASNDEIEPTPSDTLFQDDFSDKSGNWYTYEDANGTTDYQDDGFRIYINESNSYHWTNPNLYFSDTRIEVEATKLAGPEENDFGIICRYQDDNNFYFFTISSDGYYGIAKIVGGMESFIGMENLEQNESVIKSGETINIVRADCIGNTLALFVNGQQLAEVSDSDFTSGDIGLIASTYETPGTDILFDNLIVRQP